MDPIFTKNAYYRCVNSKIPDVKGHVEKNLQFKYVDISLDDFKNEYSDDDWLQRKFIAIPKVLFDTVCTIAYIALAVIAGMVSLIKRDETVFKASLFTLVRNLEMTFGDLTTIINDQYGQYHVQQAKFNMSCYSCVLKYRRIKSVHYKVLGLPMNAKKDEVRKAYQRLIRENHPDKAHKNEGESDTNFDLRKQSLEEKTKNIIKARNEIIG